MHFSGRFNQTGNQTVASSFLSLGVDQRFESLPVWQLPMSTGVTQDEALTAVSNQGHLYPVEVSTTMD